MNSILPFMEDIVATRHSAQDPELEGSCCGIFDVDAKLVLMVGDNQLIAFTDRGYLYDKVVRAAPGEPQLVPACLYSLPPGISCSSFTNLQRLLVMLPEATP
jgi:hypothetical protein